MSLPKRVVLTMATQRMIANHPLSIQKNIQSLITNKILSIKNTKLEITNFEKNTKNINKTENLKK